MTSIFTTTAVTAADGRPIAGEATEVTVTVAFTYPCLIYRPGPADASGAHDARWPLIVFRHGLGERGTDLELVKRFGPPQLAEKGRHFPFILVAPQCPDTEWWNIPAIDALVGSLIETLPVDSDRVVLTGLSMGAFATWALAARRPERYAAIVPVCGGGDLRNAGRLINLPVWAFHGDKDTVVPPSRSLEMVAAIRAAGGHPHLTVYPDTGHDCWTAAYRDDALYAWMLARSRGRPDPLPPDGPDQREVAGGG